jgi:hypothetical protein
MSGTPAGCGFLAVAAISPYASHAPNDRFQIAFPPAEEEIGGGPSQSAESPP